MCPPYRYLSIDILHGGVVGRVEVEGAVVVRRGTSDDGTARGRLSIAICSIDCGDAAAVTSGTGANTRRSVSSTKRVLFI